MRKRISAATACGEEPAVTGSVCGAAVHAHAQVHDLTSTPSLCFTRLSSSLLAPGLQPAIISRFVSVNSFAN